MATEKSIRDSGTTPKTIGNATIAMAVGGLILIILAALMFSSFFSTLPSGGRTSNSAQTNSAP
jgi:hypothetical protein